MTYATIGGMRSRRLASLAAAVVAVVGLLTGCVRAEADLVVDGRNDTVSGTIAITAPLAENTDKARQNAATTALAIESRALPGLRGLHGVTAEPIAVDGGYGTRLTLERVDIDDLYLGDSGAAGAVPLVTRENDTFVVHGTIDAMSEPDAALPPAEGERPSGADGSYIGITLTFPGPVQEVGGSKDLATIGDTTITWASPWDTPIVLDATAAATSAVFPPWIWKAVVYGLGGLAVLALLGLGTVWLRSRND